MNPKKLFVTMMALVVLQFGLVTLLCAEDAPTLGKDEGLFRITFHLPPGTTAKGNYFFFSINAYIIDVANRDTRTYKNFTLAPGTSSYTVYLPVKAAGGSGQARVQVGYTSSEATGIIPGFGNGTKTIPVSKNYWYYVKVGETCEIDLVGIPGALVSGTVTLPASATPEHRMDLHFLSQTKGYYNCHWYTTIFPNADKSPIYYSLYLPKDMDFSIYLDGVFGANSQINDSNSISTAQLGPDGLVHDIQIPEPRIVSFADPYFEKMFRTGFNPPTGKLCDYTVNVMNNLIVDDSLVKTLSDLSQLQSPTYVTLKNLKNFAPYQDWINTLKIPPELTIDGNWKLIDYSFVKNIKNCRAINLTHVSAYADLSVLQNLGDDLPVITDSGNDEDHGYGAYQWEAGSLQRHIALNKKAGTILASIIKPGMSDGEKELAIHDYIIANTVYDYDSFNGKGHLSLTTNPYTADGCLLNGLAVCQGYANAFYFLANSVGIECRIVVGQAGGGLHAWNMVKLDGDYYLVDTTWDDQRESMPDWMRHKYFNITSQDLRADHSWVETDYPVCTAFKLNYAVISSKLAPSPAVVTPVKPIATTAPAKPAAKTQDAAFVTLLAGRATSKFSNYYKTGKKTDDFQIGRYEVTQAEWLAAMGENPSTNKGDTLPVENVEWLDCLVFCNKLSEQAGLDPYYTFDGKRRTVTRNLNANGYRLPTDLEWEVAASGGGKSESLKYSGGEAAVVAGKASSAAVGSKVANELGIFDMSGNVAEWCWDADTDVKAGISSPDDSCKYAATHLFRGGSYNFALASTAIRYRVLSAAEAKKTVKGLRLAKNK